MNYDIEKKIKKMCEKSFCDKGTYLYIDRHGNIFPSCRTYVDPIICNLKDREALNIVNAFFEQYNEERKKNKGDLRFDLITVELSNICHASCVYCFQNSGEPIETYKYYQELLELLLGLNSEKIFFAGGEILDQKESLDFIKNYRKKTDSWLHLKTNGHFDKQMAYEVKQCFDSVMISFNGFSESSYNTIMNVSDVEKTKSFCNELKKLNVNMCLKFLCSPIVIQEISYFLKWAIDIEPASVVLQEAFLYEHDEKYSCKRIGSVFNQLDNSYWKDIYKRVAVQISNILKETKIDNYSGFLCADEGLFRILPLPEEYRSIFDTSGIYNLK